MRSENITRLVVYMATKLTSQFKLGTCHSNYVNKEPRLTTNIRPDNIKQKTEIRSNNSTTKSHTRIGIFQFFLEPWERRPESIGKLEEHFVHDEDGFLS